MRPFATKSQIISFKSKRIKKYKSKEGYVDRRKKAYMNYYANNKERINKKRRDRYK